MNNINAPLDLGYICRINEDVSRDESLDWGVLRKGEVGIGGTDYRPAVPEKDKIDNDITEIFNADMSNTERALELYCYCCKNQLFWDGNKRTAFIAANKYLIEKGCGLLTINDKDVVEFNTKLTDYYDNEGNKNQLKSFLYDKCINAASFFESDELREMREGAKKKQ
ncbi:MAG: Fic family protein [Clostridia bacterium]